MRCAVWLTEAIPWGGSVCTACIVGKCQHCRHWWWWLLQ